MRVLEAIDCHYYANTRQQQIRGLFAARPPQSECEFRRTQRSQPEVVSTSACARSRYTDAALHALGKTATLTAPFVILTDRATGGVQPFLIVSFRTPRTQRRRCGASPARWPASVIGQTSGAGLIAVILTIRSRIVSFINSARTGFRPKLIRGN
jgi:hypothetical protein